jgi:hypothetical protein
MIMFMANYRKLKLVRESFFFVLTGRVESGGGTSAHVS